jgi:hypothetical protein
MATSDEYARWIVDNADKRGTPEFETVAAAYQESKSKPQQVFDPTEGMSNTEKFLAGTGKGFVDLYRGGKQLVGLGNQQEIDDAKRLDAPLMKTGAGITGNIVGNVAALAPAVMIPGVNTYLGASALGAGSGLLNPIGSDESSVFEGKAKSAAIGGAVGPLALGLGRGIVGAVKGAKALVEPFYKSGQEAIVGRTLSRFSDDPAALAMKARSAQPPISGVRQTFAEATMDPGAATLQRAAQSISPDMAIDLQNQQISNNSAMVDALKRIGGTSADIDAATAAREQATGRLYGAASKSDAKADPTRVVGLIDRITEKSPANKPLNTAMKDIRDSLFENYPAQQRGADAWKSLTQDLTTKMSAENSKAVTSVRTVMDRVRKGTIDPDEALEQIAAIKKDSNPSSQTALNAIDYAVQQMKTPEFVLRENPQHLQSAFDNIKSLLSKAENSYVKKELITVKNALAHQIGKAVPEFKIADKTFAQMSVPINRLQVGQELLGKAGSNVPDITGRPTLYPNSYFGALSDEGIPLVKSATNLKNRKLAQIMSQPEMDTIQKIGSQLQAQTAANNLARSVGSNTAQNLASQNLMRQLAGPLGFSESFLGGPLAQSIVRPLAWAAKGTEPTLQKKLAEALLDPKIAASLLEKMPPDKAAKLISELQRFVPVGAVAAQRYAESE